MVKPCERREVIDYWYEDKGLSINRACSLIGMSRSVYKYKSKLDDEVIKQALKKLAEQLPTRGFDCYFGRLRNEGYKWNRKRVLRVYRQMGLKHRIKRRKRRISRNPERLSQPIYPDYRWSMDFMSDALDNGRKIRILNIIDDYNREALWIGIAHSCPSEGVIRALEILDMEGRRPEKIRLDNGPEFISTKLIQYTATIGIELEFIEPSSPAQNAYIERFNRHYREDVLDAYAFDSIESMQIISEKWRDEYNNRHSHGSLKGMSPIQFKHSRGKDNFSSESVKAKMNDELTHTTTQSSALTDSSENIENATKGLNLILLT